jgi:hypothetical protein
VAFRPTLTDGLALSENNTLISNQENLVKRYLKMFYRIKRYEEISERQNRKSMILVVLLGGPLWLSLLGGTL